MHKSKFLFLIVKGYSYKKFLRIIPTKQKTRVLLHSLLWLPKFHPKNFS